MIQKLIQFLVLIVGGLIGGVIYYVLMILSDDAFAEAGVLTRDNTDVSILVLCIFSVALIFNSVSPYFTRKTSDATRKIGEGMKGVPATKIITGTVGLIFGMVIALLISMMFRHILTSGWYTLLTVALYGTFGYFGLAVGVSKGKDFQQFANRWRPEAGGTSRSRGKSLSSNPKILDTSVIIDGRVADVIRAGFLEGPYIVADCVLQELQHIADSSNSLKRVRGRRGLEILEQLREEWDIVVYETEAIPEIEEIPEVDVKLVKLSKLLKGSLVTTDYNLNKVATIYDVRVLNINDLANAIKPVVLPGEPMLVDVIKQGKTPEQGIGYLDDGTMIVVENGRDEIGKSVTITVTSVIQTSAGKMIFGRVGELPEE